MVEWGKIVPSLLPSVKHRVGQTIIWHNSGVCVCVCGGGGGEGGEHLLMIYEVDHKPVDQIWIVS